MVMKTKIEIIDETVEYYSSDVSRRSIKTHTYMCEINEKELTEVECMYNGENGNKCAFSRVCKDDVDFSHFEGVKASSILLDLGYEILKDEYQIADSTFWNQLQSLHDAESYWNEEGITEIGKAYVEFLKKKHAE